MKQENIDYKNPGKFRYNVIKNISGSGVGRVRNNLEYLLDLWPVFVSKGEDVMMDYGIPDAFALQTGVRDKKAKRRHSMSQCLTVRQLFYVWRIGKLVHPAFYDKNGNVVHEKVYHVGITVESPEEYGIFGIIPSCNTTLIANRPGILEIGDIEANIRTYYELTEVAGEAGMNEIDEISTIC